MQPACETLPCGMKLVMMPCEAESVAVGVFVASGSRDEPKRLSGISHFIEHMLFKGTRKMLVFLIIYFKLTDLPFELCLILIGVSLSYFVQISYKKIRKFFKKLIIAMKEESKTSLC